MVEKKEHRLTSGTKVKDDSASDKGKMPRKVKQDRLQRNIIWWIDTMLPSQEAMLLLTPEIERNVCQCLSKIM